MAISYNIYASPWGGTAEDIDWSTPVATGMPDPIRLTGVVTQDGTRYLGVRAVQDGIEELNTNVVRLVISGGQWVDRYQYEAPSTPPQNTTTYTPPTTLNPPTDVVGTLVDSGVRISWGYSLEGSLVPDGFIVSNGTTTKTVDFDGMNLLSGTVPVGASVGTNNLSAFPHRVPRYSLTGFPVVGSAGVYSVQAYRGSQTSTQVYITVSPETAPSAISGTGTVTWTAHNDDNE